ncbi:MAG: methylmalonyl-CoA mutase family protein [Terracidiphilus sp.]
MAIDYLLQEFPPVSTELWEEVIRKDLKGADYATKLIWQTAEGLAVKPYYRTEDIAGLEYPNAAPGAFPYARSARATGDWRIREEIDAADPEEANRAAHSAVLAGAGEIAYRNARFENAADLEMLLANLEEISVHFENAGEPQLRLLMAQLNRQHRQSPVSTGWNPLANLDFAAEIVTDAPPELVPFNIHGEEFEESGATAVEEVGFTLAAAIAFMAGMQDRKIDVDRVAASIAFSFSIGATFFFQIAKLRAFRMMWAQAVESFGGTRESAKAHIHARTSRWNETIYAPRVNILRGTTEAMAAVFGGADSITVAPFDECYKAPDEATRRLARNTQIILKQEAMLSRVADPGAGSYCLEVFTDYIARAGWKAMQEIEAVGGYQKAVKNGLIAQALGKSLAAREEAITSRRRIVTGTSQHANITEKALDRVDFSRIFSRRRGTLSYEKLRLHTEQHVAKGGKNPRVLLAESGDAKMRSARSGFASNFFACAGFDLTAKRFTSAERIAASDADLIVLCSSDAEYLALATEVLARLKSLKREIPVIIAGNPDSAEQLRAAGVADFVHLRSNPIEFLTRWQQRLGIKDSSCVLTLQK